MANRPLTGLHFHSAWHYCPIHYSGYYYGRESGQNNRVDQYDSIIWVWNVRKTCTYVSERTMEIGGEPMMLTRTVSGP